MATRREPPLFPFCCACGAPCPDKPAAAAAGWDWFTGYLSETVHFCPRCKMEHTGIYGRLLELSRIPPAPPERAHSVHDVLVEAQADRARKEPDRP